MDSRQTLAAPLPLTLPPDGISNISVLGLTLKSARKLLFLRNVANHRIITFIVRFMQPDVCSALIKEAAGSSRKTEKHTVTVNRTSS